MSSAPDGYDPNETLSGNWTDVALVTDVGTTEETEVFLTRVAGDITVSENEVNSWQSEPNASRYAQSGKGHVDYTIEVPLDHDADADLETASIVGATGERVFNHVWSAVRLYVFKEREDADGEEILQREAQRVRADLNEESFASGDPASATLEFTGMGIYKTEFTTV